MAVPDPRTSLTRRAPGAFIDQRGDSEEVEGRRGGKAGVYRGRALQGEKASDLRKKTFSRPKVGRWVKGEGVKETGHRRKSS